jgi:spermidine dehydrogenase
MIPLFRRGRHKIYATTSTEVERNIRQQLQSLLGAYGFNHEIDIQAITVNRIPNEYADWNIGLDDPEWGAAIQTIRKSACRSAQ